MATLRFLHDHGHDHDHGHGHGGFSWERAGHVLGAAVAVALVTLFGLMLPNLISRWGSSRKSVKARVVIQSLLTAFAAGGFWGLAIIHMLLEAVDAFVRLEWGLFFNTGHHHHADDLTRHSHPSFPGQAFLNPAYMFAILGYLFMLGVQNFAMVLNNKNRKKNREQNTTKMAKVDSIITCLALTVHAYFEGLIIGLPHDTTLVWVAAASVMGHKWAEAFALAHNLSQRATSKRFRMVLQTIFFLSSPVGAICGLFIASYTDGVAIACLTAVSAGILIFVAGHCTEDVFAGHCHSAPHPQAIEDAQAVKVADLESPNREMHTHGHGISHCDDDAVDLSASSTVFVGRLTMMAAGSALVFGMMCLHMIGPGHSH